MRFTAIDPVKGKQKMPLTLHRFLYCANEPINRIDLDGRWAIIIGGSVSLNVGGAGSKLISNVTKMHGIAAGALARNAIIGGLATEMAFLQGGTAGFGAASGER